MEKKQIIPKKQFWIAQDFPAGPGGWAIVAGTADPEVFLSLESGIWYGGGLTEVESDLCLFLLTFFLLSGDAAMKKNICIGLLAVLVAASAIVAQPLGTDIFAANIRMGGSGIVGDVLRITPSGTITTPLPSSLFTLFPNMVAMDNNNKDLIVLESDSSGPQDLLRIYDVVLATPLSSIVGPPGIRLNWFSPRGDGDFYAVGGTGVYILKRDGSPAVTLTAGTPLGNLHSCVTDLATGGVAVGDLASPPRVHVVAPDGSITTTHLVPTGSAYSMTRDHRDGAFIVGTGGSGSVFSFDQIGTIRTINAATGTNCNAIAFDRWAGDGEIVVGSNPILRMTTAGVIIKTHSGIPPLSNSGMCLDQGRNLVARKTGSPNRYDYDIHIQNQGLKNYVLGLSITGFTPGIPIGTRDVQLVLDDVLVLSVKGLLTPFLRNNIGVLDAFGDGKATLDLSSFGNTLTGLKVWSAVVTVDTSAPSNIGIISRPVVTVLE